MGCGGSKLDPEHNGVPERLRPILRRRLEEIRARRNRAAANGLSKKELLGEGGTIDHSEECSPERMFDHTRDCPPTPQKITVGPDANSGSKLSSLEEEHGSCREEVMDQESDICRSCGGGKKGNYGEETRENWKVEQREKEEEEEVEVEVEKEEERLVANEVEEEEEDDMMMVAPSSPSFRVYCMGSGAHDSDGEVDDCYAEHIDGNDEDHRTTEMEESSSSNEISVKQPRKAKRGTMFKKMIPKGGKNIFNNKSFHYFPCSSNDTHLLQKAAA